ncbi:MAG TPA: TIGR03016 family PEP-CTERM system-associated outer membrane protein [Casimicrobiaceae bacterium]|nr:TIGR03016 family PEP-CTERM system-associated outer membrane protein [Casimicrobiaceae bacterium]
MAHAQKWTVSASAGATATYNHYIGANQPDDGLVACLTASLAIRGGEGGRLKLNGTLGANQLLCIGGQGNSFAPAVNLAANLEVIEKFFFIDATANASTSYVSPFGPQPANLTVETNNRQITQTYSVSPYIQGVIAPKISYSLRDDNVWTPSSRFGDSSVKAPTTYYNNLTGQMNSSTGYWGWSLDYSRQYYDNGLTGGPSTLQTAHAIASYQVDPQLSLSLRGGYERDKFSNAPTEQGIIYGAGMNWRPTERTSVNGHWEHRFFGSSYSAQLSHRLPNIALSANLSRGLSSYPQIAFQIPGGVTVAQFLDAAFTTRIPDPVERAQAVAQFLAQSGLPPILISPLNFYTTQISLQQTARVSAVWIGKRNSIGFTVFRSKNEQIAGTESELPVGFQFATNNAQTGCGVNYSHRLSGFTNLVASATYTRTTPNGSDDAANNARSNNFNTLVGLSTQFSPKTTGSVGLSYFTFDSPGSSNTGTQSTVSVYASISHTF